MKGLKRSVIKIDIPGAKLGGRLRSCRLRKSPAEANSQRDSRPAVAEKLPQIISWRTLVLGQ